MKLGSVAELLKVLVLRQFMKKDIRVAFKLMKRCSASVRKKWKFKFIEIPLLTHHEKLNTQLATLWQTSCSHPWLVGMQRTVTTGGIRKTVLHCPFTVPSHLPPRNSPWRCISKSTKTHAKVYYIHCGIIYHREILETNLQYLQKTV